MPVPMLDLRAQYAAIKSEIDAVVADVFATQTFRSGPHVDAFEEALADYTGAKYALGVSSGTDALLILIKAAEIQPGDEIITSPFTFFATGGAIVNAGAIPVFVDIEPDTFNLDPAKIEAAITPKTRAIMPVHLYGQCADMDAILEIAQKHGLMVLEDNAQAIGATYKGQAAGTFGLGAGLSFYPTKNLGAAGEGGAILTKFELVARQVKLLRCHGMNQTYVHEIAGTNSHLHSLQAAVLNVKLKHLDDWNHQRRANAAYYNEQFAEIEEIVTPVERPENHHVYHQYVIRIPRRDEAKALLQEKSVGCGVFYPTPLHRQQCFAYLGCDKAECPEADKASEQVLALPIYPELTTEMQDEVVDALKEHLAG